MISKAVLMGSLFLAGALALTGGTVRADTDATSHGAICHAYNAWNVQDIDYATNGVFNMAGGVIPVICPAPRTQVYGESPVFIVDGNNFEGTSTPCTMYVFHSTGYTKKAKTFELSGQSSSVYVDLGGVSTTDYVVMLCTLPPGAKGLIRGVRASL